MISAFVKRFQVRIYRRNAVFRAMLFDGRAGGEIEWPMLISGPYFDG